MAGNREIVQNNGLRLNILVVGAGIAGLATAITLSQTGHDVTILEQSENKKEAGFMITMGSNAMRILSRIGVDDRRARAVDVNFIERRDYKTLDVLSRLDTTKDPDPKAHPKTYYRPDLHNELKRVALLGLSDRAVKLVFGAKVVNVDIENAGVTLADGRVFQGDVLIGADGERSIIKASFRDPVGLRQAPFKIFRSLVPTSVLLSDERTRNLLALCQNRFIMFCHPTDSTVSIFIGQDGELVDFEFGYRHQKGEMAIDRANQTEIRKKLLEIVADYHPDIQYAFGKVQDTTDWEIWRCTPQKHLSQGNTVLVGDAAHSMEPTTGQGGSQGLEDAGALAVFLGNICRKDDIPRRLRLFEKMRMDRTDTVVSLAGIRPGEEETVRKFYPKHPINRSHIKTGMEHVDFLYGYDAIAESKKVLGSSEMPRANL